jgi:hypothetical protein
MGMGLAEIANKARWGGVEEIAEIMLFVISASALVAAGLFWVIIRVNPQKKKDAKFIPLRPFPLLITGCN